MAWAKTDAQTLQSECEPFRYCRCHSKEVFSKGLTQIFPRQNDSSDFAGATAARLAACVMHLPGVLYTRDTRGKASDRDAVDQYDNHGSSKRDRSKFSWRFLVCLYLFCTSSPNLLPVKFVPFWRSVGCRIGVVVPGSHGCQVCSRTKIVAVI